jgi:uncharacterized protein
VQIFEGALRTAFNQEHTLCIFKPVCGAVGQEHNGNFIRATILWMMITIWVTVSDLEYYLDSRMQRAFGLAKLDTLPAYCLNCEVRDMCNGECPKNRFILTPDGEPGLNYLCAGYKKFFNHCRPFVEAVATVHRQKKGI